MKVLQFINLMTTKKKAEHIKLCKFIRITEKGICDPD